MHYTITIPSALPAMTVKEALEDYFRHFLRTKKHVQVNGETVHWQSMLKAGDQLTLTFDPEDYEEKDLLAGDASLVQALYEDDHLIIVNKPEGMKTHANQPDEIALLNHVSTYVGKTCYVVHRLDKETSGALVFAKNPFVLPVLNRLLEDKKIQRDYWALILGNLPKKQLVYKDKLGRDRHDRRKRIVDPRKGLYAETHVTSLKTFKRTSLVNCQLQTGRTHQIRVHLSHHGHPIVGDPLYNPERAPRLMLHAHRLRLAHPFTLEKIQVEAPSPSFEKGLKEQTSP